MGLRCPARWQQRLKWGGRGPVTHRGRRQGRLPRGVARVGLGGDAGPLKPPREGLERFGFYTEGNRNPLRWRNILNERVTQSNRMVVSEPSLVRHVGGGACPVSGAGLGNGMGKSMTKPLSYRGPWLPLFLRPSLFLALRLYGPFKYSVENSSFC